VSWLAWIHPRHDLRKSPNIIGFFSIQGQIPKPDLRLQWACLWGDHFERIADCPANEIRKSKFENRNSKFEKRNSKFEKRNSTTESRFSDFDFRVSFLGQSTIANQQSLVPQRHHGIDLRRPAGRDVACQ
jgi:hypothetical protein